VLQRLERRFGKYAFEHLTLLLVGAQVGAFVLGVAKPAFLARITLLPIRVLQGEFWRVLTFLFVPPSTDVLFVFFELYLLFLYGQALEAQWGALRYNLFILVGWVASVCAAFVAPFVTATNLYLMSSVFLSFAYVNPNFELRLFFILPVRIKWLGWFTWALYLYSAIVGDWQTRALIVAGVVNFFLFFGRDLIMRMRNTGRRTVWENKTRRQTREPTHVCTVCGLTNLDDASAHFRYCASCFGRKGYCMEHINSHEHTVHDKAAQVDHAGDMSHDDT